jgi:hypothetical protein
MENPILVGINADDSGLTWASPQTHNRGISRCISRGLGVTGDSQLWHHCMETHNCGIKKDSPSWHR